MKSMGAGRKYVYRIISFFVLIIAVLACRTAREVPAERLRAVSAEKLLSQVEHHAFDFENLTVRRITVQYSDDESRVSFRASLKAAKDEKILASFSKLNIPLGRILLSPESVTYVNFLERSFFEGGYSYLSELLNFDVSFDLVQAFISNPVKHSTISENMLKQYESKIENGRYVLYPSEKANTFSTERKKFTVRNGRNFEHPSEGNMMISKLVIHPRSYVLEQLEIDDPYNGRKLEVKFSDFVKVDKYDYPGEIDIRVLNKGEVTGLNIRMRGFSTEKVDSLELVIPDRYQQIR